MLEIGITVLLIVLLVGAVMLTATSWRTQRTAIAALAPPPASHSNVDERWTLGVDMLSRRDTSVSSGVAWRLAGIYLLERLSVESPAYLVSATELLAAYVRHYAQIGIVGLRPTVELQSALTALARSDRDGHDLRRTALWGVDLSGARLVKVNFSEARLRGGRFTGARLTGANLARADLSDADLSEADLTGANLTGAILRGAILRDADLRDAVLIDADLRGAVLTGVMHLRPSASAPVSSAAQAQATVSGQVVAAASHASSIPFVPA